ncbi:MAG: hypothetical protein J5875_04915 [Paludibacteraceae bacterium]|nr:hypothetical protein [Paludibacteraceae bacterium]
MKRKIYQFLLDWKEKSNGEVALLEEGGKTDDVRSQTCVTVHFFMCHY